MNFLLHRHLAERDLRSSTAGYGAMLPDLWRLADRRVRARPASVDVGANSTGELFAGIRHHLDADAWFHRAPVFVEGERRLAERLRGASLSATRMGLLAHILWELCLDGALIRREGLAAIRSGIAAGRREARESALPALLSFHAAAASWQPEEHAAFASRMARIDDELVDGEWITLYSDGGGLARVVSSIRERLGLSDLDARDRQRLASLVDGLADRADEAVAWLVEHAPRV